MNKVNLGNTGISISKEGFGCMGLSEFYGEIDKNKAKNLLKKVIDLGVDFLDTADAYAFGENEILVGEVLSEIDRSKVTIATKCGIVRDKYDTTKRGVDNSYNYILSSHDESVRRLGTNIDLYYLHRVINDKPTLKDAMKAMAKLLLEGKIKAVGLSEVSEELLRYADSCLKDLTQNKHGISALQTEYSLMTRGVEDNGVLDACNELGITFVAYSPICRGLLSGNYNTIDNLSEDDFRRTLPRFSGDNLKHNNIIVNKLSELATEKNCTTAQLVLAWILHSPYNIVPIPGTKTEKYLEDNVAACNVNLSKNEWEEISHLTKQFEVIGQRYTDSAMKSYDFQD